MNDTIEIVMEDVSDSSLMIETEESTDPNEMECEPIDNIANKDEQSDEEKERLITENFLSGKLSFTEYTAQMEDDVNDDEVSDEPITSTTTTEPKPEVKPVKRIRRKLPIALKGLVGEANLRYARGDHSTAEKMCLEVIRQVPTAPEPYLTLAQIYDKKNPEKSLQFDLIAAHLSPYDEDQWIRLGKLSEQMNDNKQADTCYAKAIIANPSNIDLHLKRIHFFESTGEKRSAQKAKFRSLGYMTVEHHEIMIPMVKELTKQYFKDGELNKARDSLNFVFKVCVDYVTPEFVNMMLEILLALKQYKPCLEIFVQYCNINVEIETDIFSMECEEIEDKLKVISYQLPATIPIDLHIKFIVCLIHLKSFDLIDPLLLPLLSEEENVEKNGDLYLDVAEALMEENHHKDALKLLVPLVKSENFGLAAVWLRHAECLNACELHEQAIDSYKRVMELQPEHLEVRHPLTDLLMKLNRQTEALAVLEQDENYEIIDPSLLAKRCKLLKELKKFNQYWEAGLLLLSRHCYTIRNRVEVSKMTELQKPIRKNEALRVLRVARGEDPLDEMAIFTDTSNLSVEDEFTLFKDLVDSCMKKCRYDLMQRFTFTCLSSKRFQEYYNDIELMAIFSCLYNEDCYHGYNLVRDLVQRNLHNKKCWNIFNMIIQKSDDCRHNRFLMRLLARANIDIYLHVLHANNCLVSGTYKYALSEYIELYRVKEDPLLAFLIGVTLFQMASQKHSGKKDYLVVQGIGFFNIYKQLRGLDGTQEACYNIGRGYHQLGMLHVAAEYYKRALNAKSPLSEQNPNLFDLKREAAFNLHLIYKRSGALDLANTYLVKYIVV